MSNELKCEYCSGIMIKPGFFDKKCKCNKETKPTDKSYSNDDNYMDGFIDGMILGDIVDTIAEAIFDED